MRRLSLIGLRRTCVTLGVSALVVPSAGCGNSDVPRVDAGPGDACPRCKLVLEEVWASNPGDSLVNDIAFALEAGEELWTGGGFTGSRLAVYDLDDASSRSFGRPGQGPEDLGGVGIARLLAGEREIAVVHGNRMTRWTVPEGGFVGTRTIEPVVYPGSQAATVAGGIALLTPEGIEGFQGWVIPLEDTIPPWGWNYPAESTRGQRIIADAATSHEAWIGETRPYGIRLLRIRFEDQRAIVVATLEVPLDWWVASVAPVTVQERSGERPAFTAPPSRLAGLHDFGEHLVLLAQQADERHADWDRRYWEPERGFDTVVLAVRVADGAILATEVIDEVAYPFTNRGRTPVYVNDRNGLPSWSLREVRLDVR